MPITPSFITANYVGRVSQYRGAGDWGAFDRATIAATTPATLQAVVNDIKTAGFHAIDVWTAHCHWQAHSAGDLPERLHHMAQQAGLAITSYAGGFKAEMPADFDGPFALMRRIGAPIFAGGISGRPDAELAPMVSDACARYGVKWAFENHPQKTVAEIAARIGGGKYPHLGIALDTGWCGIQGLDALEATKALREHLLLVHLKDITAPGSHDTCALGDGVIPCEAIVRHLVESEWEGPLCIEHEPYDRDPMPEVETSLRRVLEWLR